MAVTCRHLFCPFVVVVPELRCSTSQHCAMAAADRSANCRCFSNVICSVTAAAYSVVISSKVRRRERFACTFGQCTFGRCGLPRQDARAASSLLSRAATDPKEAMITKQPPTSALPSGLKVRKSDQEWLQELGAEKFRILRSKGTERRYTSAYNVFLPTKGLFRCAGCKLPLFSAKSKFESDCGWPVFDKVLYSEEEGNHVGVEADADGRRMEIVCARCGGHLGHVGFQSGGSATGEIH